MLALKAADLELALGDDEDGSAGVFAELGDVVDVAVADDPADVLRDGGFGDAAESAGGDRLDEESVGRGVRAGLDDLEELLALGDGVVVGVEEAEIDVELSACGLGDEGLLVLIGVVVGQGNDNAQTFVQGASGG